MRKFLERTAERYSITWKIVPVTSIDSLDNALREAGPVDAWFVTKVTDRILDYEELVVVERTAEPRDWELINEECDALVLTGGNYLQPRWLSAAMPRTAASSFSGGTGNST